MKQVKKSPRFGSIAQNYERYRREYPTKLYTLLFKQISSRTPVILDLGCGTGKSTEPLARKSTRVIGCDPDQSMLRVARQKARLHKLPINYVRCRAEKLPFADQTFDAVTAGAAFHWFNTNRSVAEIHRTLKPGGIFFIYWGGGIGVKPDRTLFQGLRYGPLKTPRLQPDKLKQILREYGFKKTFYKEIAITERRTLAHALGEFKTTSWYIKLPPHQRKVLIDRARTSLKTELDNKKFLNKNTRIRVCFGIA